MNTKTKYVVRSMTTTDFNPGPVTPYHIFLLPIDKRQGAYWNTFVGKAMTFDSPQAAQAEIDRCLRGWDLKSPSDAQVVPFYHEHMPTYWDVQKLNAERKQ